MIKKIKKKKDSDVDAMSYHGVRNPLTALDVRFFSLHF